MPCSQMISMNIRPPRPSDASSVAMLPAVKARMRNSPRLNIGSSWRSSMTTKSASSSRPTTISPTTCGFVQPIGGPPVGLEPVLDRDEPQDQADRERRVAPPVDAGRPPLAALLQLPVRPDRAEDAARHRDEEHEPPRDGCARPAKPEAHEGAGDRRDGVDAEREAPLLAREGVGQDGR